MPLDITIPQVVILQFFAMFLSYFKKEGECVEKEPSLCKKTHKTSSRALLFEGQILRRFQTTDTHDFHAL